MSDETALAFAHPEARAAQIDADRVPDRISLRDYVLDTEIGAFQPERGNTQRVQFNVVVEVQTIAGALGDDVDQVLSYDTITESIHAALADTRLNLLETLAERVAELILRDPRAARVFIRIEKLDRGPFKLGVEIMRRPDTLVATGLKPDTPPCQLAFLGADMLGSPHLAAWLDHLANAAPPCVLVVAPDPAHPGPRAHHKPAQRRIDLLHLEQAAWVLAGRDPRCVVVDSRTEIDWALRNAKMTVWAPSKLVLDATEATPHADDPLGLALWMAQTLHAQQVWVLGDAPACTTDLPLQRIPADQAPA